MLHVLSYCPLRVVFLSGNKSVQVFCMLYLYCCWRSHWYGCKQFSPVTFICLSLENIWWSFLACVLNY